MLLRQSIEKFKQRKKDLSQKLEYMSKDKKEIKKIIKAYYGLFGILTGNYKKFERLIDSSYNKVRHEEQERDKIVIYFEKKKIDIINKEYNFPDLIY